MIPAEYELLAIVELPEEIWMGSTLRYLQESRWNSTRGLMVRVDAARAELSLRRHVTIALPQHTRAKNQQVSWNDLGFRHDRKTFNDKFKKMAAAKDVARDLLNLGPSVTLESVDVEANARLLVESALEHDELREAIDAVCLVATDGRRLLS